MEQVIPNPDSHNTGSEFRGIPRLQVETINCAKRLQKLSENLAQLNKLFGLELAPSFVNCRVLTNLADRLSQQTKLPIATSGEQFLEMCLKAAPPARLVDLLAGGQELAGQEESLSQFFLASAWNFDITTVRLELKEGVKSSFTRIRKNYRQAVKSLQSILKDDIPDCPAERVFLAEQLLDHQHKVKAFSEEESYLSQQLGPYWNGRDTKYAEIVELIGWCRNVASVAPSISVDAVIQLASNRQFIDQLRINFGADADSLRTETGTIAARLQLNWSAEEFDGMPLDQIVLCLEKFSGANEQQYSSWAAIQRARKGLDNFKLQELRARIETGQSDADQAKNELQLAHAEALWDSEAKENTEPLRTVNRQQMVDEFKQLEEQRIIETQADISNQHLSRIRSAPSDQMALIRGEIGKRSNRKCVRKLMDQAPNAVQILKPVFLMSPASIAQFLPPGKIHFDLLVIDEASQVRPEDALGAIARSKQLVVVGDQKQMPPSNFFSKATSNESQDDSVDEILGGTARATEMESVLSLCEARNLGGKPRMLEWHYRSQDPSLIAVSNDEFYDGNLILPPSPLQDDDEFGMKLTRVAGVYKSGAKRINNIEAQEIVDRLSEHARRTPNLSIGVVALSQAQQCHIHEVLEHRRRSDKVLDEFMRTEGSESLFVKNLENVQGDERDVILISVCCGPQEAGGKLKTMRFGLANNDGGERRLNVLFSRARLRCEIFCSFDPGEIDLSKTNAEGVRVLKKFLDFAETGILNHAVETGAEPDSPFEEDVAKEIRNLGYQVEYQVGSAGFRIDLAVRNPKRLGRFMLAVECDGATYHSALWARERDRLRQGVLENLGWRFHRIWSTDWFYNRATEIERLESALDSAMAQETEGLKQSVTDSDQQNMDQPAPDVNAVAEDEFPNEKSASIPSQKQIQSEPIEDPAKISAAPTRIDEPIESTKSTEELDVAVYAEVKDMLSMQEPVATESLAAESKSSQSIPASGELVPYEQFVNTTVSDKGPHECDISYMADLVGQVVETEGPIHVDLIAKRVAKSFGKSRAGAQIQDATHTALKAKAGSMSQSPPILNDGEFWFTPCQQSDNRMRDRTAAGADARNADWLPPAEIDAALLLVLKGGLTFESEKLPNEVAKVFGFKRLGDKLKIKILQVISARSQQHAIPFAISSPENTDRSHEIV